MQLFRYKADRIPVLIFTSLFALDVAVFAMSTSWWLPPAWTLLWMLPKAYICSWNHHHQHLATFLYTPLNRMLELVFTFQTGISSHAWTLHHVLGHHVNYLDQKKDESRWARDDGSRMGELEYTLITAATAYPRALEVGKKFPEKRRILITWMIVSSILLALAFAYRPYNALFVFAIPMTISLLITVWITYFHHSNLVTDSDFEGSYNILDKGFNRWSGNLGYHTAHHYRQGVHWSQLPELHAQIADKIPAHCFRTSRWKSLVERQRIKRQRKKANKARRKNGPMNPVLEPQAALTTTNIASEAQAAQS